MENVLCSISKLSTLFFLNDLSIAKQLPEKTQNGIRLCVIDKSQKKKEGKMQNQKSKCKT